jgi:hypothetical protein
MMQEITNVRQIDGEPARKWFASDYFDLFVWFGGKDEIIGFQLCYDSQPSQRVFTWEETMHYSHNLIDDGENRPGRYKASPILVSDGIFEKEKIATRFKEESKDISKQISEFIYEKILEYQAL